MTTSPASRSRRAGFPRPVLKPLAAALICLGVLPCVAQVLPTGATVAAGNVVVGAPSALAGGGLALGIAQSSNRAVVNWQTFSIGALDRVDIVQPALASVLLNRVTGEQASFIAGRLATTLAGSPGATGGAAYLINPNGVTFAGTASVSVGGLVASTLDITGADLATRNAAFMASGVIDPATARSELSFGNPNPGGTSFGEMSGVTVLPGARIVAGTAAAPGAVVLLGTTVANGGTIQAPGGSVALAAAGAATLVIDPVGDGLTTLRITSPSTLGALVGNLGTIEADGGRIALQAASTAAETVVRQGGVLRARTLEARGGQIVLSGGDGSSGNAIAIEGGSIDATGGATAPGGSVLAGASRLDFSAGAIDASGSQGGTVALAGSRALTIAPPTTIAANGASGAGGTVVLGAGAADGIVHVSGAVSARGATAGGSISTTAATVEIGRPAGIDAGGGTGANGRWQLTNADNLLVTAAGAESSDAVYRANAAYVDRGSDFSSSRVADAVVGTALGRSTDVTIDNRVVAGYRTGGVVFEAGSQVQKVQGGNAVLTVDSTRNIAMEGGSAIRSTAGALGVDFDANAGGTALPATGPAAVEYSAVERVGTITVDGAVIATRGGDIRFYGQRDAVSGRAVGGYSGSGAGTLDGITINAATLDTCAGDTCAGAGAGRIVLRGQGGTQSEFFASTQSGDGIVVRSSTLRSGDGAIALDGRGGLAANGISVRPDVGEGGPGDPVVIESRGGDITLTGASRGLVAGDVVRNIYDTDKTGVRLEGTTLQTGGNIAITGTGADLASLQANAGFLRQVTLERDPGAAFSASDGVVVSGSNLTAGAGKALSITGTAGSRGFTVTGVTTVAQDATDALAVQVVARATNGLQAAGGQVRIAGGAGDVSLLQIEPSPAVLLAAAVAPDLAVGTTPRALVDVASASGPGGAISITGRNIAVQGSDIIARLDGSGATGGGGIDIRGTGIIALGADTQLRADASGAGNGGRIAVVAGDTLRAFGTLRARGGGATGVGGAIETSGGAFDLRGVQVDAAAGSPAGRAGTWTIDPRDVAITHGAVNGALPANPFAPLAASAIQDADINRALDAGTSVTLTTGTGGSPTQGDITFGTGVDINYATAAGALTLRFDAQRSIRSVGPGVVIRSSGAGGPLDVVFNADANASGPTVGGGQVSYDGDIRTNGGAVTMNADWSATGGGDSAIHLTGVIDTRAGGVDGGAGGDVRLAGRTTTPVGNPLSSQPAVWLDGASVLASTGRVSVDGIASNNTGVQIDGNGVAGSTQGISTTSGAIAVTGRGTDRPAGGSSALRASSGVEIEGARVVTTGGAIVLRGQVADTARAGSDSAGVRIVDGARIATTGGGDIEITGSAVNGGIGVALLGGVPVSAVAPGTSVVGGRNVLLRAGNDGSADAIVIQAPVTAADTIDLRPGGVDRAGAAADRVATPIVLGGAGAGGGNGFAVSAAELGQLAAPTLVAGSSAQAATITVAGAIATPRALTLQNDAGGDIRLDAAVSAAQLGLLSAGTVSQGAAAPVTAGTLLARSTRGDVVLENAANDVASLGGGAAGRFSYVDAGALRIATTGARGFDAAGNLPQTVGATELAAGQVTVRTLAGDLALDTGVRAATTVDLVAGARFQNPAGQGITAGAWRIWADTWVGETRGGLAGTGSLPNLYGCAYSGPCGVAVPAAGNHFVYRQQPAATVAIDGATREAGAADPAFGYRTTGLILGDGAAAIAGTPRTAATAASPAGDYAIDGSFTSPAGYVVSVVAGNLRITAPRVVGPVAEPPAAALYKLPLSEVAADTSNVYTYTFDRNLGRPPVCFAIGSLDGDRAADAVDVLAREWTRVRSRPNLSSCVSTERRNGCSDF